MTERQSPAVVILGFGLISLLAVFGLALLYLRPGSSGAQMPLTSVISAAVDKRVPSVRFLDQDARITGRIVLRPGAAPQRFWTAYPHSDAVTNDLLQTFFTHGTNVVVDSQNAKAFVRFVAQFLLPLMILANLFALLFFVLRGSSNPAEYLTFARLGDKRLGVENAPTRFADVAAAGDAIAEVAEVRDYLASPAVFERLGALPPKGVLLVGPPGCGKTLLARAVAGEAKASFFSVSGSEFVESLVGVGAARVRDLFRQARGASPAIIFIDELDAVGRQRGAGLGGGHDEREQTLNELLVQMDGFLPTDGVAVMAATNRVDILDPALLRPGRFDRLVTLERPDLEGRLEILRLHARAKRLKAPDKDLPEIARATPGFTGADLANVLNEAALLAVRQRASAIDKSHLEEAIDRVLAGPRRKGNVLSVEDRRRIACHEAGHAVVASSLGKTKALQKVSIISRGRGVGHLAVLGDDSVLPTRTDLAAQISIAMAGLAAEEIVFGEPSVGAEVDLARATNAARDMAGRFGMSDRLGRMRVLHEHREIFLGRDYLQSRDVSQPTLEHLDAEVTRILDEQEMVARTVLRANRDVHAELSSALVDNETVGGTDLHQMLERVVAEVPAVDAGKAEQRT